LSAGWSFDELFIAGQFAEILCQRYREEIKKSRGKRFKDRFVLWLSRKYEIKNRRAKIKVAPEMRV
jgi:hypothetical protein